MNGISKRRTFLITQSLNHLITAWLICVLLPVAIAEACPGCKEALLDPHQLPQKLAIARGYAWSIGLFLAMPAALVAGIGLCVWRAIRHARRARRASGSIDTSELSG